LAHCDVDEPLISRSSCIAFKVRGSRRRPLTQIERQAKRFGQTGNERRVLASRFASNAVIEMSHGKPKGQFLAKFMQSPQQADAIGASRNGDNDAATSPAA